MICSIGSEYFWTTERALDSFMFATTIPNMNVQCEGVLPGIPLHGFLEWFDIVSLRPPPHNCMLPGVPGDTCFQEGAVLAKGVTPFGIGILCCYPYFWVKVRKIVLLPILLGKVSCVPKTKLCELYVVKV